MASEHDDMKHELRATKTVGGSIDTLLFTVRNRLQAAVDESDWTGVRALLADLDDRDGIRSAISHGTVAADQARDLDPDAPVPASNPGSLGGNVYGSQGPADTARKNAMGEPVGDPRVFQNGTDGGSRGASDPKDAAPGVEKYSPGQGEDTRGRFNAAEKEQHDREHPNAGKEEPVNGEQTGQQRVNPTGEDQRTDRPSFGASDGERRREPEPA